ncbi:MAG: DHHW family protein [Clostridia bacterium]
MKKANAIVFLLVIFGFFMYTIISPSLEYSSSERRKLAQYESPTLETFLDGDFFDSFSEYVSDQFPIREEMRTLNAVFREYLLLQQDVDGIYSENGYIFKTDYKINEKSIEYFTNKTNSVYNDYIKDKANNYYVSIIPDKACFDSENVINSDAKEIAQMFLSGLENAEYVDIFDSLSLESYYKTDTHWSQDKLFDTMSVFANSMGFVAPEKENFVEEVFSPFYGVYYGQMALPIQADELVYLTNDVLNSAVLYNLEKNTTSSIYNEENLTSKDPYNIYSDGAAAFIEIESPLAKTDKELVIFRDSFGSSIAPLFLEEYSKVTLVDLRYFSSSLLDEYVDFENADVLVLYSSLILNSNINLK